MTSRTFGQRRAPNSVQGVIMNNLLVQLHDERQGSQASEEELDRLRRGIKAWCVSAEEPGIEGPVLDDVERTQ